MAENHIFIGREKLVKRLSRDVFQAPADSMGYCYSLIGPNGVGKTTLIAHLAQMLRGNPIPNVYYFRTEIMDSTTYWDFWIELIRKFSKAIPEEKLLQSPNPDSFYIEELLDTYDFFCDPDETSQSDTVSFKRNANSYLNTLFRNYKELGIRIIITIDEFDRARDVFRDGAFFQRLFSLTPKGGEKLLLSIITISRRSVGTIAHHMQEGSDFEDAFTPLPLRGFSNKELNAYFETYTELSCGVPSKEIQQQILYLCGRSPGLLMRMRHEIDLWDEGPVDISHIYSEYGGFIKTAYQRMCTLMQTEYVDQHKNQDCMGVFIQKFIGPAYSEELMLKVQTLYSLGFITRTSTTDDIFVLAGVKEPEENEGTIYEPLSAYFVDYVKTIAMPDATANLAGLLEKTERIVRAMLANVLQTHYPQNWEEILEQDVPQKNSYLDNLRVLALRNDFESRSIVISKLNVLAFNDYYDIIRKHWDITFRYFREYSSLQDLKKACQLLNDSRNSSAHLNLEILNDVSRKKLQTECERMIRSISSPSDDALAPEAQDIAPEQDAAVLEDGAFSEWIEKVVTLTDLQVTNRGSLRGTIQESNFVASMSAKYLSDNQVNALQYVGQNLEVKIIRWDSNAKKFNAEFP